ncbi:hypothetical protein [Lactobacillus mulieris]|uniref:hypothetical protein n=1 Tax=Lactobacillus mulieris TaxID=2508708 RepID=UPI0022AC10F6|nr:hypothetical protein [Lactobacillus mulieris]MCZ3742190.1 hypothetical protein [Lactobacillus mulieris]MCZ3749028.1 hypothetical protein [Lactobacillus mulieris]MCZ3750657.1 hypothetical protein [Lactobacillus mulieris]MDT9629386.1 hypothetical protein [Lactobacillus mulieris]
MQQEKDAQQWENTPISLPYLTNEQVNYIQALISSTKEYKQLANEHLENAFSALRSAKDIEIKLNLFKQQKNIQLATNDKATLNKIANSLENIESSLLCFVVALYILNSKDNETID